MNKFFLRKYAAVSGRGDEIANKIEANLDANPYKALGSAPGSDAAANLATGSLFGIPEKLGIPITPGDIGHLVGYTANDPKNMVNPDAGGRLSSLIPGVGGYRTAIADRAVDEILSKGKRSSSAVASERFGSVANSALLGLLGGLVGGPAGATVGYGLSTMSNLLGYLGGYAKSPRTARQHADYLNSSAVAKNLLIPGHAGYQKGRRARQRINAI